MKRSMLVSLLLLAPLLLQAQKVSHVRIVRMSLVNGSVEMNQQDGQGWHKALLNAPISERTELRTGPDGQAAVEFEDASSVQLTSNSQVDFTTLSLENGVRQNVSTMARGIAFFSLHKHDSDAFVARFPGGFATVPDDKSWFRIDLGGARLTSEDSNSAVALQAEVRVLNGKVRIQSPDQVYFLKKNDQLTLHASQPADLVKNKALDSLDNWSEQLDTETQVRGRTIRSAPGYGLAELSSYGTWSGGYWYPSVATGWSPYANGNWFWDPAMGYTWVSGYPWGWLPYHYGTWMMSPGGNWYWMPGTNWNYAAQPTVASSGGTMVVSRPPLPPPPTHRRADPAPAQSLTSALAQPGRTVRQGLPMPPVDVRRILLPPAAQRPAMSALNPAQRAAIARANQSRNEEIMQQQWRMQSGMRGGMPVNRSSSMPANSNANASTPRMAPMPRMEPAPRMNSASGGSRTPH